MVLQDGYIPVAELRTVLMKEGPALGSLALPGHIWTLCGIQRWGWFTFTEPFEGIF